MRSIHRSLALLLLLFAISPLVSQETPGLRNLGIAGRPVGAAGDILVAVVLEPGDGTDLNGDGDARDAMVGTFDVVADRRSILPIAAGFAYVGEGTTVFDAREREQGADLNGDGDTEDRVVHVHSLTSGETTNLSLATDDDADTLFLAEGVARFSLFEAQGTAHGLDVDGDGLLGGHFTFLHDVRAGETRRLDLATAAEDSIVAGDFLAIEALEARTQSDLNGDGDAFDSVPHVVDLRSGAVRDIGLAGRIGAIAGGVLALEAEESWHGADLNGDGDLLDGVLHVHELESGVTTNRRIAPAALQYLGGDVIAMFVLESDAGEDLNGDGDAADLVVHVHRFLSGLTRNLGLADRFISYFTQGSERWLVVSVDEPSQGLDLNLDGDRADRVLHVVDLETFETVNYELAADPFLLRFIGDRLALEVVESDQGKDLNGDGDLDDSVVHTVDLTSREVTNLGLAIGSDSIVMSADWLSIAASEHGEDRDFNGDGDREDFVAHATRLATGETANLGVAVPTYGAIVFDGRLALQVFEQAQGEDLNGDGDTQDMVLHVAELDRFFDGVPFRRGDANADAALDLSDAVFALSHLFLGGSPPSCLDAADSDDSGDVDISDPVLVLNHLFATGPRPAEPFEDCGTDPTADGLGCGAFSPCGG